MSKKIEILPGWEKFESIALGLKEEWEEGDEFLDEFVREEGKRLRKLSVPEHNAFKEIMHYADALLSCIALQQTPHYITDDLPEQLRQAAQKAGYVLVNELEKTIMQEESLSAIDLSLKKKQLCILATNKFDSNSSLSILPQELIVKCCLMIQPLSIYKQQLEALHLTFNQIKEIVTNAYRHYEHSLTPHLSSK